MKLTAKVQLKERNAELLISAFFKDFNEKSSIFIHGNEADLEIDFEEQPTGLINAICQCDILVFKYGKVAGDIGYESVKKGKQNSVSTKRKKLEMYADVKIPKLDEFFEKFSDFDLILTETANWLELGGRTDYFKKYVDVAAGMEEVVGLNIAKILKENYGYSKHAGDRCSKKIQNKVKYSTLELCLILLNYKKKYEKNIVEEVSAEDVQNSDQEEVETEANKPEEEEVESIVDKPEEEETEKEITEKPIQDKVAERKKKGRKNLDSIAKIEIPILDEKAKESRNFDEFLTTVSENLLDKKSSTFFAKYVQIMSKQEKISATKVMEQLKKDGFSLDYRKKKCDKVLIQKFNCTTLEFAIKVLSYQNKFNVAIGKPEETEKPKATLNNTETSKELKADKPAWLINITDGMDMGSSIWDKVEHVCKKLKCPIKGDMFDVIFTAMKAEISKKDMGQIISDAGISNRNIREVHMDLAMYVREYTKAFDNERLKAIDFLKQLKAEIC